MRLHADSYFTIGSAHITAGKPAQDYAMERVDGDSAVAVVSDGCSTGGRTDVGARIVALATIQATKLSPLNVVSHRDECLLQARHMLGLDNSDLLATCLYTAVNPDGAFYCLHGDGVVAVKYRSGRMHLKRFDWLDNTPFYPAYGEADRERFVEVHGGDMHGHRLTGIDVILSPAQAQHVWNSTHALWIGMNASAQRLLNFDDIEFIAVFSDGVTQIENVDWKDAVVELMSFKNTTGEFVKRRAMATLRKFREVGKGPVDDFSMAAIHVEH